MAHVSAAELVEPQVHSQMETKHIALKLERKEGPKMHIAFQLEFEMCDDSSSQHGGAPSSNSHQEAMMKTLASRRWIRMVDTCAVWYIRSPMETTLLTPSSGERTPERLSFEPAAVSVAASAAALRRHQSPQALARRRLAATSTLRGRPRSRSCRQSQQCRKWKPHHRDVD
jgi:hypothetical protein